MIQNQTLAAISRGSLRRRSNAPCQSARAKLRARSRPLE
jgi:hypothetical protein